jgi:hypothetical protein
VYPIKSDWQVEVKKKLHPSIKDVPHARPEKVSVYVKPSICLLKLLPDIAEQGCDGACQSWH